MKHTLARVSSPHLQPSAWDLNRSTHLTTLDIRDSQNFVSVLLLAVGLYYNDQLKKRSGIYLCLTMSGSTQVRMFAVFFRSRDAPEYLGCCHTILKTVSGVVTAWQISCLEDSDGCQEVLKGRQWHYEDCATNDKFKGKGAFERTLFDVQRGGAGNASHELVKHMIW